MGRSIVIIHVASLQVANYPHITAFHEDNSNVQMWPDPVEWSGSETIPKIVTIFLYMFSNTSSLNCRRITHNWSCSATPCSLVHVGEGGCLPPRVFFQVFSDGVHTTTHLGVLLWVKDASMGIHDPVRGDWLGRAVGTPWCSEVSSIGSATGWGMIIRERLGDESGQVSMLWRVYWLDWTTGVTQHSSHKNGESYFIFELQYRRVTSYLTILPRECTLQGKCSYTVNGGLCVASMQIC